MVRTQIQLESGQVEALKKMAAGRHLSMAEIIRQAIDRFLRGQEETRDSARKKALKVAGRFRTGIKDLADRHDDYLKNDL